MRIATVTFNPAIDQTVTLDRLVPGQVHRSQSVRRDAGGKGINVASCLADWGQAVTGFGFLGADNVAVFENLFAAQSIQDRFARVAGETRVNIKVVDSCTTTDINMSGVSVSSEDVENLVDDITSFADHDALVVLSGSLPPGCPAHVYADLVAALHARGAKTLIDTSGAPLAQVLQADIKPDIIKPNRHELATWAHEPLAQTVDVLRCARALVHSGVGLVVVSMGEDGALFVSADEALRAHLVAPRVDSTVGAGDAMVAGMAAAQARGLNLEQTARLATAFAVGTLAHLGAHVPSPSQIAALARDVVVTRMPDALTPPGTILAGETP